MASLIGQGGQVLSPDQVETRRRLAQQMFDQGTSGGAKNYAQPGGMWQGLNDGVNKVGNAISSKYLEGQQNQGRQSATDDMMGGFDAATGGGPQIGQSGQPTGLAQQPPPGFMPNMMPMPGGNAPGAPNFMGGTGAFPGAQPNANPATQPAAGGPTPPPFRGAPSNGGDIDRWKAAISNNESGGNYAELGPVQKKTGDRAFGKYQVMGANIPSWTREALGQELTPQQFLSSPEAQEKVFEHRFGGYVKQYGSPEDAASAWFTGRPRTPQSMSSHDSLGTSGQGYVDKFSKFLGGPQAQAQGGPPGMQAAAASPMGAKWDVPFQDLPSGGSPPPPQNRPQFGEQGRRSAAMSGTDTTGAQPFGPPGAPLPQQFSPQPRGGQMMGGQQPQQHPDTAAALRPLMAALSNPWLNPAQAQVLASMAQPYLAQLGPTTYQPISQPNGSLYAFDPRGGTANQLSGPVDEYGTAKGMYGQEYTFNKRTGQPGGAAPGQSGPGGMPMPGGGWSNGDVIPGPGGELMLTDAGKAKIGMTGDTVPWFVDPKDGKTYRATGTGVEAPAAVQQKTDIARAGVGPAGETEFSKTINKGAGDEVVALRAQAGRAAQMNPKLDLLDNLGYETALGKGAYAQANIGAVLQAAGIDPSWFGIDPAQPARVQTIDAVANSMLSQFLGVGGFPSNTFTNADRDFISQILAGAANVPGAYHAKIALLKGLNNYEIKQRDDWIRYSQGIADKSQLAYAWDKFTLEWPNRPDVQKLSSEIRSINPALYDQSLQKAGDPESLARISQTGAPPAGPQTQSAPQPGQAPAGAPGQANAAPAPQDRGAVVTQFAQLKQTGAPPDAQVAFLKANNVPPEVAFAMMSGGGQAQPPPAPPPPQAQPVPGARMLGDPVEAAYPAGPPPQAAPAVAPGGPPAPVAGPPAAQPPPVAQAAPQPAPAAAPPAAPQGPYGAPIGDRSGGDAAALQQGTPSAGVPPPPIQMLPPPPPPIPFDPEKLRQSAQQFLGPSTPQYQFNPASGNPVQGMNAPQAASPQAGPPPRPASMFGPPIQPIFGSRQAEPVQAPQARAAPPPQEVPAQSLNLPHWQPNAPVPGPIPGAGINIQFPKNDQSVVGRGVDVQFGSPQRQPQIGSDQGTSVSPEPGQNTQAPRSDTAISPIRTTSQGRDAIMAGQNPTAVAKGLLMGGIDPGRAAQALILAGIPPDKAKSIVAAAQRTLR